ncbi:SDR family NAD(P)-dependent oxidoreductase [Chloroflexota bacterium]
MMLSDRVAIVTGGAHGMGRSTAQRFADEGCSVAVVDILADEANKTAAKVSEKGGEALAIQCDITDSGQVQNMVEKVISKFGKVDILVNTAGLAGPAKSIDEYSQEEWERVLAVNLSGPFLCSKYVVPHMKKREYGRIINFSSVAAIYPKAPRISYGAAKAGLIGLTLHMAVDLAAYNILVNVILPGPVRTEFFDNDISPGADKDEFFKKIGQNIPIGRVGAPEEVAGVALFLASSLSSYVTGAQICAGVGEPFRRFQR